jgi:hypothetical protein
VIEALVAIVWGIAEAILALLGAIAEALSALFVAGGEALGIGELLGIFFVVCIELLVWVALAVVELFRAAFHRRMPRKVSKPVIWRPSKLKNGQGASDANAKQEARVEDTQ